MHNNFDQESPLILIADDDTTTRMLLKMLLKKDQYQVAEVENGQECLDAFSNLKPDAILLDAMMPVLDGFKCCSELQKLPNGPETPVLMITGLDDQVSVDRAFAAGAIDYVTKPIHPPLLRQRLRRILQTSKAEAALRESEKKYRSVVNNLKEIIFQTDINGQLTFLNPAWETITGFRISESLGQDFQDFIHPEDHQLHEQNFTSLIKQIDEELPESNSQYNRYQIRFIKKNQGICWVEIYAYLVVNNNNIMGISGTINDITERKIRERYLKIENQVRKILAESDNIKEANLKILDKIGSNLDLQWGEVWLLDTLSNQLNCITIWEKPSLKQQVGELVITNLINATKELILNPEEGLAAQIFNNRTAIWLNDLQQETTIIRLPEIKEMGLTNCLSFPLVGGDQQMGLINFFAQESKQPEIEILKLMNSLGSQIGQFIRRKMAEEEVQRQNKLLQSELNKAADYVRSLLPNCLTGKVSIDQQFIPSLELGGDAFDYYWLDEDNLAIYLLDVAGHGVQSALLSVSVLNLLRSQSLYNTDFYQPWTVLEELNRMFQMDENGQSYFTIWYGVYNVTNRQLVYNCGGHPPAILINSDGTFKKIGSRSIPIGMLPDLEFEDKLSEIPPGSTLYIFSDGIYEIYLKNGSDGEIWGLDALIELLTSEHQTNKNVQLNNLIAKIQKITKTQVFGDDLSILQVKL